MASTAVCIYCSVSILTYIMMIIFTTSKKMLLSLRQAKYPLLPYETSANPFYISELNEQLFSFISNGYSQGALQCSRYPHNQLHPHAADWCRSRETIYHNRYHLRRRLRGNYRSTSIPAKLYVRHSLIFHSTIHCKYHVTTDVSILTIPLLP